MPLKTRHGRAGRAWIAARLAAIAVVGPASADELVQPKRLIMDSSLPTALADAQVLAARRYDTFWNTGADDLARAALAPEPFIEAVDGHDFVVIPYTLRNNDILLVEGRNYSPAQFWTRSR